MDSWEFSEGSPGNSEYPPDEACVFVKDTDEVVCWLNSGERNEIEVNAAGKLIAAAPELLAACKSVFTRVACGCPLNKHKDGCAIVELEKALTKVGYL